MKYLLSLLFVALFFTACEPAPPKEIERDGVALTVPSGWEIGEDEMIEDNAYYLTLERSGFTSSGLCGVTWINGYLTLNEWLDIYKEGFAEEPIYQNANVVFGEKYTGKLGGFDALSLDFTASILGVDHEGTLHTFYVGSKTFGILQQSAVEDRSVSAPGFKVIEESIRLAELPSTAPAQ